MLDLFITRSEKKEIRFVPFNHTEKKSSGKGVFSQFSIEYIHCYSRMRRAIFTAVYLTQEDKDK